MTTTVAAASRAASGRLGAWCGWVMVGAAVLIPPIGWFSPLGLAPLVALMGLLCLPAFRLTDADRPALIVLAGALVWAAVSTTWSPRPPEQGAESTILQLALALPLYWSAVCGARRADPRLNRLALSILAWGLALFGAVLLVEVLTDAAMFKALYETVSGPIRPDVARSKDAHATFVLAVLWPVVLIGRLRRFWQLARLAVVVAGAVTAAHVFLSDAPVIAFPLSAAAVLVVWLVPKLGPRLMAFGVAAVWLLMPALVWLLRESGDYGRVEQEVQVSWSTRMAYWSRALDGILQQPVRGWGLDASRAMGPGIQLHPHNGALQIWLELGLVGAVGAAAFWGLSLARLERDEPDLAMAGVAGSATAYVLFAWINYGLWQQWWLALGVLICVLAAMHSNRPGRPKST